MKRWLQGRTANRNSFPHRPRNCSTCGDCLSEALHLKVPEVGLQPGLLLVREGKFRQTRWVPLDPTAFRPLHLYNQQRQKRFPLAEHFFASESGATLRYSTVHAVFSRLRRAISCAARPPRIHDLRHTHACRVLQRWQASRQGADGRALILTRYLGHRHIRDTYWYLHAVPELMAGAGKRFEPKNMKNPDLHNWIQRYFQDYLVRQRNVSPATVVIQVNQVTLGQRRFRWQQALQRHRLESCLAENIRCRRSWRTEQWFNFHFRSGPRTDI